MCVFCVCTFTFDLDFTKTRDMVAMQQGKIWFIVSVFKEGKLTPVSQGNELREIQNFKFQVQVL